MPFLCVDSEVIAAAGLALDVVGVIVLLLKTSSRHIEAEIYIRLVEACDSAPNQEWISSITPAEHQRRLSASRRRVTRTHLWIQGALGLIVFGFMLQAIALFI